jgi:predicted nucleic acid-binding protein
VRIFVDSNVIIYLIEQPPDWGPRTRARISTLHARGDQIVLSDLVRMECRVGPLAAGDAVTLAAFDSFFASSHVQVVGVTAAVCDRAAAIRAAFGFRPLDALHLAAAVEHGCERFLTHDARLGSFADISLEVPS